MPQMPFFLPLPPPLCYNDIVGTAEKPAFSCPDPQPIRYRENRRWGVPGPVVRNSGPRGIFPPNPSQNQKGPPHNPAGPALFHPHRPNGTPPPAHLCRSAGLRPAGQTVLRTVLGGGRRPPPRRRRAPPALRAALPLQAPRHPHAKAPAGTAGASLCQYSSIGSPSGPAAIFLSVSSSISCRSAVR